MVSAVLFTDTWLGLKNLQNVCCCAGFMPTLNQALKFINVPPAAQAIIKYINNQYIKILGLVLFF